MVAIMSAALADGFVLNSSDNVATLGNDAKSGQVIVLRGAVRGAGTRDAVSTDSSKITIFQDIASGHKIAVSMIEKGAPILKYGMPIGFARDRINAGEHVHTHNLASNFAPAPAGVEPPLSSPVARIDGQSLNQLIVAAMQAAGAAPDAAQDFATHCVSAELSGVTTHGIRRIRNYLDRLHQGGVDGDARPVLQGDGAVLMVDGRNGIGHHVARFAADAAVARARQLGAALALVKNSNHLGYAGFYTTHMAQQGMVGVAVSNGQVLVGPPGACQPIFSNNPIAISAPMGNGQFLEFDMATSVTSRANIARAAETGQQIPEGMALDISGNPTTDAVAALAGILLPLGGSKGFGFIAALEVLAGILPGGAYANQVASKETSFGRGEGTSHFLLAIDPAACCGAADFTARMSDLAARVAAIDMHQDAPRPHMPGARRAALRQRNAREGIPLDAHSISELRFVAHALGVPLCLVEGNDP
jgi:LDH2 family malate/lactate/ureidoglycolate dehydrogenase